MHDLAAHVLPTLESLGIWSYWIVAAAAFLEGWWITGVVAPGTLIVDAGGAMVRLGYLDFFDLAWFVAAGAILGGEAGWFTGRWLGGRIRMPQGGAFRRAQDLVRNRGPLALILGRFLGPVACLAPLAAALSGMERRRFVIWNIASGIIYALVHVSIGYVAGDLVARLAPYLPRVALPLGLLAAVILVTWLVTRQVARGLPALSSALVAARDWLAGWAVARAFCTRHPRLAAFVAQRFDAGHGGGLLATAIAGLLIYLVALFVDGALDLALVPETQALDDRVANLAHAYWSPAGLTLAGWVTQAGHVPVATLVALGAVLGLAAFGRRAAAIGLATAVAGNALTVTLLKLAFGRERPGLSYFLETSHSFPSGHAAISVALYGSLALALWRERLIPPTLAIVGGVGLAAGIGFTRIYLVEHYLSDVLNGWVVGAIWMVIGFGFAEGLRRRMPAPGRGWRGAGMAAMLACFAGAGWFVVYHQKSPAEQAALPPAPVSDVAEAVRTGALSQEVLTLDGTRLPPVSLVSVGRPADAVGAALQAAGWQAVPVPGAWSILEALKQDLTARAVPGATVPPAFHAARPAAITLRSGDGAAVVRIWEAGQTGAGATILVLAAAPEHGIHDWTPEEVTARIAALLGGPARSVAVAPEEGRIERTRASWRSTGQVTVLGPA